MKENFDAEIKFRLPLVHKNEMGNQADLSGLSLSEYLRRMIEKELDTSSALDLFLLNKESVNAHAQLNNMLNEYKMRVHGSTVNINQIAKIAHQNSDVSTEMLEKIMEEQEEIHIILTRIFNGVGEIWRQYQSKKPRI